MLFTDPMVSINDKDYLGIVPPRSVMVKGAGAPNSADFTLTRADTGAPLTVSLNGNFASNGTADKVDIFAGSPLGFSVKTVDTGNFSGCVRGVCDDAQITLHLPSDGVWNVGIGPEMPMGPMAGPPPMSDWMPPVSQTITVSNGVVTVPGSKTVTFTLTASKSITGHVCSDADDCSNTAISNAEIYAYSPQQGFGNHTKSLADGSFSLKVPQGSYKVGVVMPGMPSSQEVSATINADGDVFINGSAQATTDLLLTISKSDLTISGKVTNGTNIIQGVSVYAYCDSSVPNNACFSGPGYAQTMTDSSGNYILYVANGTWKVGSYLPQFGDLAEKTVTVSGESESNQNFAPVTVGLDYYDVSGRVYSDENGSGDFNKEDDTALSNVVVKATNGNKAFTNADGEYTISLPAGYSDTLEVYSLDLGGLPAISLGGTVSSALTGKDCVAPKLVTLTVSFGTTTVAEAFVDVNNYSHNLSSHIDIKNAVSGNTTIQALGAGVTYDIYVHVPGLGEIEVTTSSASITGTGNSIDGDNRIIIDESGILTVALPTTYSVSGTVTDGTNLISDAWVEIGSPQTGVHFGTQSDADGAFSGLKVATGTYMLEAHKSGYISTPNTIVVSADLSGQTITLAKSDLTISGQVKIGSSGAPNAFVRAEKLGGGFAGTQSDTNGNYTLTVDDGDWLVHAMAEGYKEESYANYITVSGSAVSNIDITLATKFSKALAAPKVGPMTPSQGGIFENSNAGVFVDVPANALGRGSNAGQLQAKDTNNVLNTPGAKPVGGVGKQISAVDSNGTPITTLDNSVVLKLTYSKDDLTTGDNTLDTLADLEKVNLGYWDDSAQSWISIPTTITTKATGGDASAPIESNLSNLDDVTLKGTVDHFTVFAVITSGDSLAPNAPISLSASAGDGQVVLTWVAPTTNTDDSSLTDLLGYEVYRSTDGSTYTMINSLDVLTATYTDTSVSNGTLYYYKVTTADTSGNESVKTSAVSATPEGTTSPGGGGPIGGGDTIPPTISGIDATASQNGAVITWTTDDASLSWIVYGTSTDYGSEEKTTTYASSHSVTLEGLSQGTTYYYQVKSQDTAGNVGTYTGKSFTTLGEWVEPVDTSTSTTTTGTGEMTQAQLVSAITAIQTQIVQIKAQLIELIQQKITEIQQAILSIQAEIANL